MFGNVGISELIIIAGIALVVIGPEKFPEFAKIAMRAYRDLRGYVDDIKHEMAEEMKPVQREIRELAKYNPEDYIEHMANAVSTVDDDDEAGKKESASNPEPEVPSDSTPYEEVTSGSPSNSAVQDASETGQDEAARSQVELGNGPQHDHAVPEPAAVPDNAPAQTTQSPERFTD
jgi:sec-independent protein translocase protein TatB